MPTDVDYAIRNAAGELVATHRRRDLADGKSFVWLRPDGSMGLGGQPLTDLPLYGSELVAGAPIDRIVVVCEGERAAEAVAAAGFLALGTVTGAASAPGPGPLELLRGRHVALWPDADGVGRAHMERIALRLQGIAAGVRLITWQEAPAHGDAANVGDTSTIADLIDAAEPYPLPVEPPAVPALQAGAGPIVAFPAAEIAETLAIAGDAAAELERVGLGYRLVLPSAATVISVARIRENRGEVTGELSVRCDAVEIAYRGEILGGRFNLSSFAARKTTAGLLSARTRGASIAWDRILEVFCQAVLRAERVGEPIVTVGRAPRRSITDYVLSPVCPALTATTIYGAGGTGKTTLAAAIAVSVASGREVIGGLRPTRGGVLILDYERSRDDWNDLVAAISAGAGIDPPDVDYRFCARPLEDQVEDLAAHVAERGTRLLIVDSVSRAMAGGREGGDPNDQVIRMHAAIRALKVGALLIDHVAGENLDAERVVSKPIGGVSKLNAAQGGAFELRRERSTGGPGNHLALFDTKRNFRAALRPIALRMEYEGDEPATAIRVVREDLTSPELTKALSLAERIDIALRDSIMALEPKDIASAVGMDPADRGEVQLVRNALNQWKDRRFRKLSDGRWGLATHAA